MEVVTLTGNLLAEWTVEVVKLQTGKTHRAERINFQVGGKGINVSRILRHLGVETEAHGFAGGALAEHCTVWLHNHNVAHRFYPLEQGVRPGMVVRETGDPESEETTFLGLDLSVPTASWEAALEEVCPETRQQRCWMHKTMNVLNCLPQPSQPKAKAALHDIWQAETKDDAGKIMLIAKPLKNPL